MKRLLARLVALALVFIGLGQDGQKFDLNTLIANSGWTLRTATDINESGERDEHS